MDVSSGGSVSFGAGMTGSEVFTAGAGTTGSGVSVAGARTGTGADTAGVADTWGGAGVAAAARGRELGGGGALEGARGDDGSGFFCGAPTGMWSEGTAAKTGGTGARCGGAGGGFGAARGGRVAGAGGSGVRDAFGGAPGRAGGMLENGGRFGCCTPRGGGGSAPTGRNVLLRPGIADSARVGITLRTGMGPPVIGGGSEGAGTARPRWPGRGGGADELCVRSRVSVPFGTVLA
jgi:hypothetical protein